MIEPTDLHAYVDGELSPEQMTAMRSSLDTSPVYAREVEAIQSLKSMLRSKTEAPASQEQWKSCVKRLNDIDKTRRTERVIGRFAPGLCFGLVVCILAAGQFTRHGHKGNVGSSDIAQMLSDLTLVRSPKASSLPFDKRAWEKELLRQSEISTPKDLTIREMRSGTFNGVPVKEYSARDQNGDVAIIQIGAPLAIDGMESLSSGSDLKIGSMQGTNCVVRVQKENTIIIKSDRSFKDLAEVAGHIALR